METTDFVANVLLTATGENSTAVSGDDDWLKVLSLGNLAIDEWSNETDWVSLYSIVSIGTVSATASFDLDDTIRKLSNQEGDFVRINHTDGTSYTDYTVVAPNKLKLYDTTARVCARIGVQLVFNKAFVSTDPQFGGTINVPGYLFPDHLVADSDEVPVDDPNWLVMATAAEWARNDLTLAQNYPLILAKANELMASMKTANAPQVNTIARVPVARAMEW